MSVIDDLLGRTSRTFALSIPLLPEPCRRQVSVAYLLFRIADTLEDEPWWTTGERIAGLGSLDISVRALGATPPRLPAPNPAVAARANGQAHEGYARLLDASALVLGALGELDAQAAGVIHRHLSRTIAGMVEFLERPEPPDSIDDLRRYCYAVAGIVGELCTDLFALASPQIAPHRAELLRLAPAFGEGLQLVNILRDESDDAIEQRRYIPPTLPRAALFDLAASDLADATGFVRLLERGGASEGIVAFNTLNALLAIRTLALVRRDGPGAKLGRQEVGALHGAVVAAARDRAAADLLDRQADAASLRS